MFLSDGGGREDAAVDRPDAYALRLITLVLVEQIGVVKNVLVTASDSCGGAFLADEEPRRLIAR
jgi:hypothetical protein